MPTPGGHPSRGGTPEDGRSAAGGLPRARGSRPEGLRRGRGFRPEGLRRGRGLRPTIGYLFAKTLWQLSTCEKFDQELPGAFLTQTDHGPLVDVVECMRRVLSELPGQYVVQGFMRQGDHHLEPVSFRKGREDSDAKGRADVVGEGVRMAFTDGHVRVTSALPPGRSGGSVGFGEALGTENLEERST